MEIVDKIVNFEWCTKCEHFEVKESEEPCHECLNNFTNANSRRPVNFKEAKEKKGGLSNGRGIRVRNR